MTVQDWVEKSATDIRQNGVSAGASMALRELIRGGVKRIEGSMRPIGGSIWDKEWDVLVILDACRPDHLFQVGGGTWLKDVDASLGTRWSEASCSRQWISRAVSGADAVDKEKLAYLTGNPFSGDDHPHTSGIPLEASEYAELWEGWRHYWGAGPHGVPTMPPGPLTDRTIDTWRHRDERGVEKLIVHYMQPHYPIVTRPEVGNAEYTQLDEWGHADNIGIFEQLRRGQVDRETLHEAFLENTRWILNEIEPLATNLDAAVAVSADHGNAFGEWGSFGHPEGDLTPAVRRVPWVTFEAEDSDSYHPEIPSTEQEANSDVAEQLEALGYR